MDYSELKRWLKDELELPINRKERFFTATVLPSLLFHKGLSNFYRFLRQIHTFPAAINQENTKDNFLFYTEYNLKESAGTKSVGAKIAAPAGDTPDVIIEILKPQKALVVIEAKMYSKIPQKVLGRQMKDQKKAVIDPLKKKYALEDAQIFHVALIPKKLLFKSTPDYHVINWEFFTENNDIDVKDNYFYHFLKFALEHYRELVSDQSGEASTVEGKMTGNKIYESSMGETTLWVGRQGGKKAIEQDVRKGIWESRQYAVNSQKPQDGQKGNWLSSQEFVEIVETNR